MNKLHFKMILVTTNWVIDCAQQQLHLEMLSMMSRFLWSSYEMVKETLMGSDFTLNFLTITP